MVSQTSIESCIRSTSDDHSKPGILPTQFYGNIDYFLLESGQTLENATVAFSINGRLNAARNNVILICHALSGNADVLDWWSTIFNQEQPAIDLDKFCVISFNCLGSPYGSSSPLSYEPNSSSAYGKEFPKTTIRDDVRIQKQVLSILGIRSLYCVIGASMGGMLAIEWPLLFDQYVKSVILIATAARQSPWAIAWAENQRSTVRSDAKYRDGLYGDDPPLLGLAAARMAAMLSYRTHSSFEKRFGRRRTLPNDNGKQTAKQATGTEYHRDQSSTFLAQTYLQYQGQKFNARFDANCYLHILDKIDTHDISRCRYTHLSDNEALEATLGQITQPTLVVGIPTDGLYPIAEQMLIAEHIPNAHFASVDSDDGHDGFLLEGSQVNELLQQFFNNNPVGSDSQVTWSFSDITPLSLVESEQIELANKTWLGAANCTFDAAPVVGI